LGGKFFALVFTLDLLKGLIPTALASLLLRNETKSQSDFLLWLLVAFAAIAGHMFSLFLKFKGGKGVATSAGVLLGVFPYYTIPGLIAIAIWIVLFKITRYVSVASIFGSLAVPILYVVIGGLKQW